jgi:hypothetical protein
MTAQMTEQMEGKIMSQQQAKPKLPETPFNGVVTSVIRSDSGSYTYLHLAIAAEDNDPERPVVAFETFCLGSNLDPRAHLQQGDKVRVTYVSWHGDFVRASSITFDVGQFAKRQPNGSS